MNYGRRGIRKRQKAIGSPTTKVGKFCAVSLFIVAAFAAILVGVAGLCAGIGLFMGVVDTAPDISNVDVAPAGYSTNVYDNEGNQMTKLIAENSNRVYVKLDLICSMLLLP